jgi:hypothetical protein
MNTRASTKSSTSADTSAEARVAAYDWQALTAELDSYGCAVLRELSPNLGDGRDQAAADRRSQ